MSLHKPSSDFPDHAFEKWLASSRIQPRDGFRSRLRDRMQREDDQLESELNRLFRINPQLHNPQLAERVRARLRSIPATSPAATPDWFRWLAPLSAAAILTLAFVSFQLKAPSPSSTLSHAQAPSAVSTSLPSAEEASLTEIFALASNLHQSADLSRLKSVDDLALLFD